MYVVLLKYFLKARNVAELVEWLPCMYHALGSSTIPT